MEVVADILTEVSQRANKTRIMYRANLNFSRFERYFSELDDTNNNCDQQSYQKKQISEIFCDPWSPFLEFPFYTFHNNSSFISGLASRKINARVRY